jgi:hypothetical protein
MVASADDVKEMSINVPWIKNLLKIGVIVLIMAKINKFFSPQTQTAASDRATPFSKSNTFLLRERWRSTYRAV